MALGSTCADCGGNARSSRRQTKGFHAASADREISRLGARNERIPLSYQRLTGFGLLPISSLDLTHDVSSERISSKRAASRYHECWEAKAIFAAAAFWTPAQRAQRKSSLAAHFVNAASRRGEKACISLSKNRLQQIMRNMRSIGVNLKALGKKRFAAIPLPSRPTLYGLETHLAVMHQRVRDFKKAASSRQSIPYQQPGEDSWCAHRSAGDA